MARIIIPNDGNWTTNLAEAVQSMRNGDTLIVATEAQTQLAQRAVKRMRPDVAIFVVLAGPADSAPDFLAR